MEWDGSTGTSSGDGNAVHLDFANDIATWSTLHEANTKSIGGGSPTPAELRVERSKALNRVAQRRYRQKNKAKDHDLADHVAEMQKEVAAAEHKRRMLETECKTLREYLDLKGIESAKPNPAAARKDPIIPNAAPVDPKGMPRLSKPGIVLTECCKLHLTHQQVMTLSMKDQAYLWTLTAVKAKELMDQGPTDLSSPAGQKLKALMKEKHGYNPLLLQNLLAIRQAENNTRASPAFWRDALKCMSLSDEQKQELHAARCRLKHSMDQLLQERIQIQESFAALEIVDQWAMYEASSRASILRDHYRWWQLAQALKDNVDKAHCATCLFYGRMYRGKTAIDALQEAKLVAFSYPLYPDMVEIVEAISRELSGSEGGGVMLDVDILATSLEPATALPNPAVDRYLPLEEKLTQAIYQIKYGATHPQASGGEGFSSTGKYALSSMMAAGHRTEEEVGSKKAQEK